MIHTMIFQSLPLGYSFQQCEFLGSRRIPRDWAEIFLHPCSVSFQTVLDWELPSFLCAPLRGKHRCWACGKYRTQILKNQTWSDFTAVKRIPKGENKDVLSFLLFPRSKLEGFFCVCVCLCFYYYYYWYKPDWIQKNPSGTFRTLFHCLVILSMLPRCFAKSMEGFHLPILRHLMGWNFAVLNIKRVMLTEFYMFCCIAWALG